MPVQIAHKTKPGHVITVNSWHSEEEVSISCACGFEAFITKGPGWEDYDFGTSLAETELLVRDHLDVWSGGLDGSKIALPED